MELIDKSALVAEIEDIKSHIGSDKYLGDFEKGCNFGRDDVCDSLLNFINTLEVKDVDLEKETEKWWKEHLHLNPDNKLWMDAHQSIVLAKHFFELGFKAQKGE